MKIEWFDDAETYGEVGGYRVEMVDIPTGPRWIAAPADSSAWGYGLESDRAERATGRGWTMQEALEDACNPGARERREAKKQAYTADAAEAQQRVEELRRTSVRDFRMREAAEKAVLDFVRAGFSAEGQASRMDALISAGLSRDYLAAIMSASSATRWSEHTEVASSRWHVADAGRTT